MLDAISSGLGYVTGLLKLYQDDLLFYTGQHLMLVAISMAFALAIGLAAGIILSRPRMRRYGEIGMQVFNISNAVPPMAVLMIALVAFGIGDVPTIIALCLASILPIARNTYQGLLSVSPSMCEAARGIGLSASQQLWLVELPNAIPTIMGGIRTALAINIGSAPLAFYIGANSLGSFIVPGVVLNNMAMLMIGVVTTSLMALLFDALMALLTRLLSPRGALSTKSSAY